MERRAAARGRRRPVPHSSRRRLDRLRPGRPVSTPTPRSSWSRPSRAKPGSARIRFPACSCRCPGRDQPRPIRAVYQDGTRLSGDLEKVEKAIAGAEGPGHRASRSKLPIAGLRSLVVAEHRTSPPLAESDSTGRLELDGLRLPGRLVDGRAEAGCELPGLAAARQRRRPVPSSPASPGEIIYREPPPPALPRVPARSAGHGGHRTASRHSPPGVGGMVVRFAQALAEPPPKPRRRPEERRSLYLRDGDVIPSVITKIDDERRLVQDQPLEEHLRRRTPRSRPSSWRRTAERPITVQLTKVEAGAAAHLAADAEGRPAHAPDPLQERRLPPRARSSRWTTRRSRSRSGSRTRTCPRDRISRIIWLHADELDPSKKPAAPDGRAIHARAGAAQRRRPPHVPGASSSPATRSRARATCWARARSPSSEVDQLLIGDGHRSGGRPAGLSAVEAQERPGAESSSTAGDGGRGRGGDTGHRIAAGRQAGPRLHARPRRRASGSTWPTARARRSSCSTSGPPGAARASRRCRRSSGQPASSKTRTCGSSPSTFRKPPQQVTALLERQKLHVHGRPRPRRRRGRQVQGRRDPADRHHRPRRQRRPPVRRRRAAPGRTAQRGDQGGARSGDKPKEGHRHSTNWIRACLLKRRSVSRRSARNDRTAAAANSPAAAMTDQHDQGHAREVALDAGVQQAPDEHRHRLSARRSSQVGRRQLAEPDRKRDRPGRQQWPPRQREARRGRSGPTGHSPSSAAASR